MKKGIIAAVVLVLGFLVLSYAYCPEVLQGRMVNQADNTGFMGMARETTVWNANHPGSPARWTGSMFSGMPTAPIIGNSRGDLTKPLYDLFQVFPRPVCFLFISLLGAFLLMLAFGMHPVVAAGGAIAVTFCSYNMQIIQVGHNTKMFAIAFLPWVLAALVFTYRKALQEGLDKRRRWAFIALGAALFGIAVSFQVKANHPQISYYLAILILIYVLVLFVWMLIKKMQQKYFWIASVLLLALGLVGIATNASKVMPTMEYTPYSMRGGTTSTSGDGQKGLDIDYATAWSYGWEELPNLLIPNYNGGSSSGALGEKSETVQLLRKAGQPNVARLRKSLPLYWGPQPFTAGPMYMGAITIFLFIFGLMYWKGKEKWWLLIATVLAVLLALGYHFMWLTRLFYNVMPMYNKFRTVSMILVVLQFTLPLLGFLMLDKIVQGGMETKELRRQVLTAGGVTIGLTLLLALIQGMFGAFTGSSDAGQPDVLVAALAADRMNLMWMDTLRSVLLIAAAAALLLWGAGSQKRLLPAAAAVCVLVLADLFIIDKRYLSSDDFIAPKTFYSDFDKRPADDAILADTDPSFRVVDLSVNVFNDSHPSYWHKNIGGYSPAKLQRYQEYIEGHINRDLATLAGALRGAATVGEAEAGMPYLESLASLNCRYVILSGDTKPLRYRYARGNAWFESGEGQIEMTSYTPDKLEYTFSSATGGLAVFSEVYYPAGWVARLDGSGELPIELYAGGTDGLGPVAGNLLRCIDLPAGEHTLEMSFEPVSYSRGEAISRASSLQLIVLSVLSLGFICFSGIGNRRRQG
ncbi:MAG: hypothetical protein J5759_05890 [Bacteroidales bacterium]|nr:hypothetical protein [Bacteroidales bacterium]